MRKRPSSYARWNDETRARLREMWSRSATDAELMEAFPGRSKDSIGTEVGRLGLGPRKDLLPPTAWSKIEPLLREVAPEPLTINQIAERIGEGKSTTRYALYRDAGVTVHMCGIIKPEKTRPQQLWKWGPGEVPEQAFSLTKKCKEYKHDFSGLEAAFFGR